MKKAIKSVIVKVMTWEAGLVLKKYKPKIATITGSVGKTSTKDAIYTVLSSSFFTRRSEKSFNTDISLPLTILGCANGWSNPFIWIKNFFIGLSLILFRKPYPQWLVLEVGADKPGDIESFAKWIKPDIAVLTRFGDVPVHVEFFPSIEDLVNEKGFLPRALKPDGIFIYNADDKRIVDFAESIPNKKISFGFNPGSSVAGGDEAFIYGKYESSALEFPVGISFSASCNGSSFPVELLGNLGRHHMYPLLAGVAVGISQNISHEKIAEALKTHVTPKARMKLIAGIKNSLVIDDSYNSSPIAVYEALRALSDAKCAGKKIAVLGDMLELGQYSVDEHKRVGEAAAKVADVLVAVGIRSRATADSALDSGMDENAVFQFEKSQEAGKYLETIVSAGDIILIKGSQSMRMERAVEEIMAHPEDKEKLLVRQEPEWLKR